MKCKFPTTAILFAASVLVGTNASGQKLRFAVGDEGIPSAAASSGDRATASLADTAVSSHIDDDVFVPTAYDSAGTDAELAADFTTKGGCDSPACGKGCGCRPCWLPRTFGSVEYTHWYSKDRTFPVLVTTSPAGTPALLAGRLDQASTQALFGGERLGGDLQAGGRVNLGFWLDDDQQRAIGVRFYANEGASTSFNAFSNGDPILARPFFDTNPLVNDDAAFLVAFPGLTQGSMNVAAINDVLGAEIYGRTLFDFGYNYRLDLMGGYQFNRIDDDLLMTSISTTPQPVTTTLVDSFDISNEFHALELGLIGEICHDRWTVHMLGKLAVGNMRQTAAINGNFTLAGGLNPASGPGGLLAQATNSGVFERDETVWSPEASFKLSYAVTDRLAVSVGYTFLYWTSVALAGDLVDTNLNSAQITNGANPVAGPQDPAFRWNDTDYWVQTIDIGLSVNY